MRSLYSPDVLLLASKKPRIKELVEQSKSMTEDEIKSLSEKPDVIRGLLLINQFGDQQKKTSIAEKMADMMQKSHVNELPSDERACHIFVIVSDDTWLKIGSSTLEIKQGWHWAQLSDGTFYISTSAVKLPPSSLDALIKISKYVKKSNLLDFKNIERNRISNLNPDFIVSSTDNTVY